MLYYKYVFLVNLLLWVEGSSERQKRYLLFTPSTQYGVFATVSIPLPAPNNLISVAWFIDAQYYNVANASYFEYLLGDVEISRGREEREAAERNEIFTRSSLYALIENMLTKHGYSGRLCLLRAICELASTYIPHNGVIGDLIQLILTPSASLPEDSLKDCYYEAEYYGLEDACDSYYESCPSSPMDDISLYIDH